MNNLQISQARTRLLKLKGRRLVIGEVDNKKVYGIIDDVGKKHVTYRISYKGKVVRIRSSFFGFPFSFPFFGFPFGFPFFRFPFF